ncbi:MAG: DUF123 domain-containing protein [bacterium]
MPQRNSLTAAVVAGAPAPAALSPSCRGEMVDMCGEPLVIAQTGFKFKSLCDFTANMFVGCGHGCPFCYVPSVSATKQAKNLAKHAVTDPNRQWGQYALLRPWDEKAFLKSLDVARRIPASSLIHGGHRAVMYCTTTDAFQGIRHNDDKRRQELDAHRDYLLRRSLELIRDHSDLRVRIQTRFPSATEPYFELLKSFGNRLLLGTSVISLDTGISGIYEPAVPPARERLAALKRAGDAGIPVYVAVAPVPPEVDDNDLRRTLEAVAEIEPCTVFLEALNVRGGNIDRVSDAAGGEWTHKTIFANATTQRQYAIKTLQMAEKVAREANIDNRLHLWPDKDLLGSKQAMTEVPDPMAHSSWLLKCWNRVSEWPKPAETVLAIGTRNMSDAEFLALFKQNGLEKAKGAYVVVLHLQTEQTITVGKLGTFTFQAGFYLYCGSASGGLKSRLHRHVCGATKLSYHIDYLRKESVPVEVWITTDKERSEHDWALRLHATAPRLKPMKLFGATDCRYEEHLFYSPQRPVLNRADGTITVVEG